MTDGLAFAIAGAKGGVGKTTTSINLGAGLAAQYGSVVVVEADLAMANIIDFVDLAFDPNVDPSLHDVLRGEAAVSEAVYESRGFDVVPSGPGLEGYAAANPRGLGKAVERLRSTHDVVLVDVGAGVSYETLLPLGVADAVVLVSTPRLAAVRDARKTKDLAGRVSTPVAGIVFTQSGTGRAPSPERIASHLSVEMLGHVPADDAIHESQDVGLPILAHDIASPAAEAYWRIAERFGSVMQAVRSGVTSAPSGVDVANYFSSSNADD